MSKANATKLGASAGATVPVESGQRDTDKSGPARPTAKPSKKKSKDKKKDKETEMDVDSEEEEANKILSIARAKIESDGNARQNEKTARLVEGLRQTRTVIHRILDTADDPEAAEVEITEFLNYLQFGHSTYKHSHLGGNRQIANEYEGRPSLSSKNRKAVDDAFRRVDGEQDQSDRILGKRAGFGIEEDSTRNKRLKP